MCRPIKVVAVALANKLARIICALLVKEGAIKTGLRQAPSVRPAQPTNWLAATPGSGEVQKQTMNPMGRRPGVLFDPTMPVKGAFNRAQLIVNALKYGRLWAETRLALILQERRGFTRQDFARVHLGGSLGRELMQVRDLMWPLEAIPIFRPNTPLSMASSSMCRAPESWASA
ncbi:hypothetical protein [Mesorhizobium neociceri]|uniref:Uncharacterized protein n=1 Tax=Mesorhizobium neociceri TaxID=1307853 RepID=A0A838B932_9HYPH|nr:hypothetical protein [Mesorhizobium neociceri]MBA1142489.1 hypothetical protein [Mesorhizobium neociceri]